MDANEALLKIALLAEEAMALAELGGNVHEIHEGEVKAIQAIWRAAREVIGFTMHEGEGEDEE